MRPCTCPQRPGHLGFTLIELVIVITIIGILAAVALPRLIDAQRDARIAKTNAIYGSLRSSAALARSRCELDISSAAPGISTSNCRSNPPFVNMDGYRVRISNRFPAATADGIDVAGQLNLEGDGLTAANITGTNSQGVSTPGRTYDVAGGTVPDCRITYLEAALNGGVIIAAEVNMVTTGC